MASNEDLEKQIAAAPVTVIRPPAQSVAESAGRFVRDVRESGERAARLNRAKLDGAAAGFRQMGDDFQKGLGNAPSTPQTPAARAAAPGAAVGAASAAPAASLPRPAAPAGTPGVQFNTGRADDAKLPTQPSIGYFIGGDGKRRDITAQQADALAAKVQTVPERAAAAGVAGAPLGVTPRPAGAATATPMLQRPDAMALAGRVAAGQRGEAAATRRDAESFLNPMSNSAEAMRRLENAQSSYFNKGSPSARAFAAEAILGQLRAGNAASATRQQQVGETLQQGASGALASAQQEALLGEARSARESQAMLQREQLDASAPVLQLAGGTTGRLGRDGVVRTLVGEDGAPVRGQAEVKGLDPTEVFKAAVAQRGEIANNPLLDPEARAAALAEFDAGPLGQALAAALPSSPQGAVASQIPPEAIAILRQNPGKAAEFESTFNLPAGAAAQYLGN